MKNSISFHPWKAFQVESRSERSNAKAPQKKKVNLHHRETI